MNLECKTKLVKFNFIPKHKLIERLKQFYKKFKEKDHKLLGILLEQKLFNNLIEERLRSFLFFLFFNKFVMFFYNLGTNIMF